jgi:hypothetical protein
LLTGLSTAEAAARLKAEGHNGLPWPNRAACSPSHGAWCKALMHWTFRGKHEDAMASIPVPSSGKEIVFSGFCLYRFADDQIIEAWEAYARFKLLQQSGAIPQPA